MCFRVINNEALRRAQLEAAAVVMRANHRISEIFQQERQRPFSDYQFISMTKSKLFKNVAGMTFSPLGEIPLNTGIPGAIGYFQIEPDGKIVSPVFPEIDAHLVAKGTEVFDQKETDQRTSILLQIRNALLGTENSIKLSEIETGKTSVELLTPSF